MGFWKDVKAGKYPRDAAPGYCGPTKHGFFCLLDEGHLTRYDHDEPDIPANHRRAKKNNMDRWIRHKLDLHNVIHLRWWLWEKYHNPFSFTENSDLHSAYAIGYQDAVVRTMDVYNEENYGKKYVMDFSYFDSKHLTREPDANYKIEQMNLW